MLRTTVPRARSRGVTRTSVVPAACRLLGPALLLLTLLAAVVTHLADRGYAVVHQCVTVPGMWGAAGMHLALVHEVPDCPSGTALGGDPAAMVTVVGALALPVVVAARGGRRRRVGALRVARRAHERSRAVVTGAGRSLRAVLRGALAPWGRSSGPRAASCARCPTPSPPRCTTSPTRWCAPGAGPRRSRSSDDAVGRTARATPSARTLTYPQLSALPRRTTMPSNETQTKAQRREAARAEALALREAQAKRDKRNRLITIGALVAGVLVLVGVFLAVWIPAMNDRNKTIDAVAAGNLADVTSPATSSAEDGGIPIGADGAAGTQNEGAVEVGVYLDYMCPICGQFEETNGAALDQLRESGDVTVVLHPISILDRVAQSQQFSTRSAAAAAWSPTARPSR